VQVPPCKTDSTDTCEYGTLTDERDGQIYRTVKIGDQWWMAQNLNYAYPESDDGLDTLSYCYESLAKNCDVYGRLYTWSAAMDSAAVFSENGKGCGYEVDCSPTMPVRGICPEGWHLPNGHEWRDLLGWIDDKLGEEDRNYMWGDDYLARAGFEGCYSGGTREYVVKLDSRFNDYYREWEYENDEDWATLIRFKIGGWYIVSNSPNSSFRVRCLMD
jgi:uncharacterized protein (TIGR02145 family)